jgi:phosphoribosylglycinamide formyltransferase 1
MSKGGERCGIVILASGNGSNLQAIIDATQPEAPWRILAVISDKPAAIALQRAAMAGIPAISLDASGYRDRKEYDEALIAAIDPLQPQLVVLAGFMRILSEQFVTHYSGRLINIHPSLLPRHRGLNTHARAIAAGDRQAGCTIHFVIPELDAGPIIAQAAVPIAAEDTPTTLAERVLREEHRLYPKVIAWFALGRLQLIAGKVVLDGEPLIQPIIESS